MGRRGGDLLDRDALGMDVVVFATINLTSTGRQNLLAFESEIVGHPEVTECYTMTGIWDYMLKIVTRDIRHYEAFVRNTLTASPAIRELRDLAGSRYPIRIQKWRQPGRAEY